MSRRVVPLAAIALAVATLTGCAQASSTVTGVAPSSTPPATTTPRVPGTPALPSPSHSQSLASQLAACPTPHPAQKTWESAAVDFADFVQFLSVSFVLDDQLTVTAGDRGPEQFRVRCPLGLLNDATHLQPPDARDGDSSYLPAGTEVFAVRGFPTRCRLMAQGPDGWHVYAPRPSASNCPAGEGETAEVPPAGATVRAPGLPDATSGGRLDRTLSDVRGDDFDAEPPAAGLVPKVSAARVYASCLTEPPARCAPDKGPTLTFAVVSTDRGGHVRPDGSVRRVLDRSPTWIVSWSGLRCIPVSGGPASSPARRPSPDPDPSFPCTRTSLVDATTGTWVSTDESEDEPSSP